MSIARKLTHRLRKHALGEDQLPERRLGRDNPWKGRGSGRRVHHDAATLTHAFELVLEPGGKHQGPCRFEKLVNPRGS